MNLKVLRVVVALSALWNVLSRPTLPDIFTFPPVMWDSVPLATRIRYLVLFDPRVEWVLWMSVPLVLLLVAFNVRTRWTALAAALLLYHFAAFEKIFTNANPQLRGLTITTIALLLISAAKPGERWPVPVVQFLFATMYFFAGWAKIVTSGLEWMSARNIRLTVLALDQMLSFPGGAHGPIGLADHPALAAALGIGGIAFELLFPLALFSRRAAIVLALTAAVFHVINYFALHITFPEMALLLVFVDWDGTMRECPPSSVIWSAFSPRKLSVTG